MKSAQERIIRSFPPIVNHNSQMLILGTIPGEESLRQQQYYAHRQNLFWKFICQVTNKPFTEIYEERRQLLLNNHLALWDVCQTCIREGSLDSDIKEVIPNSIDQLLEKHPNIHTIAFNGKKAETLFKKHFKYLENINYLSLPSTSPANASISMEIKLRAWRKLANLE